MGDYGTPEPCDCEEGAVCVCGGSPHIVTPEGEVHACTFCNEADSLPLCGWASTPEVGSVPE